MPKEPSGWMAAVLDVWSKERAACGKIPILMPPTDEELHRLLELGAVAAMDQPCPGCRHRGKACSFCRRVVPGSKGLPGETV